MQFPSAHTPVIEVADRRHVVDAIQRALISIDLDDAKERRQVYQIVVRTKRLDPLHWLGKQYLDSSGDGEVVSTRSQLVYWSDRDGVEDVAGFGIADELTGDRFVELDHLRDDLLTHVDSGAALRYYGGLRFDDSRSRSPEWKCFGGFRFVLPRIEVQAYSGFSEIRCNVVLPTTSDAVAAISRELEDLTFSSTSSARSSLSPVYREDLPDRAGWTRSIDWALEAFSHSRLGKVVLARKASFGFASQIDQVSLLHRLVDATPNCYHFLFSGEDGSAFVGASPERLFKLTDRNIWSEAVAGTRPRGATEGDDDLLRNELLLSEKDQREHQFVRQNIKDTLSELCEHLEVDGRPSEMKLARGRHLVSRVTGVLSPDVDSIDLLQALHPTPAVGGHPTADAVRAIAHLEPFDRGWYAAPIGWISATGSEFAVAIRSGLVFGKHLSLYSGAGIVGGSTADSEWAEIENKIVDFISVFDADQTQQK